MHIISIHIVRTYIHIFIYICIELLVGNRINIKLITLFIYIHKLVLCEHFSRFRFSLFCFSNFSSPVFAVSVKWA